MVWIIQSNSSYEKTLDLHSTHPFSDKLRIHPISQNNILSIITQDQPAIVGAISKGLVAEPANAKAPPPEPITRNNTAVKSLQLG